MRVDKVILRAVLSTVAAILGLMIFMICALCIVYPSTMMEITYDLGMDKLAIANAKQAYKRSDDIYYIAFATDVAISIDDYERIEACGEMLVDDDEFAAYCEEKDAALGLGDDGAYEQYVYGQVCLAVYRQGDEKGAVDKAFDWLDGSFPKNNAAVAVLVTALMEEDVETVAYVGEKMIALQADVSETDRAYLEETLSLMQTD